MGISAPRSFGSEWRHIAAKMLPNGTIFPEVIDMIFQRIRDLREDCDKTQQEISDYLHMHRSVYRRYESGEREIPVWALMKLAELYQTSTDYILGRTSRRGPIK